MTSTFCWLPSSMGCDRTEISHIHGLDAFLCSQRHRCCFHLRLQFCSDQNLSKPQKTGIPAHCWNKTPSPGAGKEGESQETWSLPKDQRKKNAEKRYNDSDFISSKECFGLSSSLINIISHISALAVYLTSCHCWKERLERLKSIEITAISQFIFSLQSFFQKRAVRGILIQENPPSSCPHSCWQQMVPSLQRVDC